MEITDLKTIEDTRLTKVIIDSGLQLTDAEAIKQSYLPYFEQMAEIKEQAVKINFENPTELDEKIARELRLKMVKIRTGSEQIKDERKRIHTLKANVEQSAWNLIKTTCQLDEEMFLQVEKSREIKRKAAEDALRIDREKLIAPFVENVAMYPLGQLSNEAFNDLLQGFELAAERKREEAVKAEEARIAKEKQETEEREIQRLENEMLKAEAAAREKELAEAKAKADADLKAQQETAAKEAAKQKAIVDAEREKQEKLLEDQRKKAAAEKAAREKAEAEAKALKDAENKRIADEKERVEAEAKARAFAEKKAAMASDKEKLTSKVMQLSIEFVLDNTMKPESIVIAKAIEDKFNAFKKWANEQINTL